MPIYLSLVRHAQSVINADGVTMEHAAIPLAQLGAAQAQVLADLLDAEPSGIVCPATFALLRAPPQFGLGVSATTTTSTPVLGRPRAIFHARR